MNKAERALYKAEKLYVLELPVCPPECPWCGKPTKYPRKDREGKWTWLCEEGCNP